MLGTGVVAAAMAMALSSAQVPAPSLDLAAPLAYEVFQRQSMTQGAVVVSGRCNRPVDRVMVRVAGASVRGELPDKWTGYRVAPPGTTFAVVVQVPAGGWYTVSVRAMYGGKSVAEQVVEHVGVGEVFVGAGQSNSTNSGQFRIQEHSGLVSSYDGAHWVPANDPQPGTHDRSGGGSFWPAFGDAMVARWHVPIGIASTGHGGTSVTQWNRGGELYEWMMNRMHELGRFAFRAVIWHQGESDTGMTSDEYYNRMRDLIVASNEDAGWAFPWFVAQVSYHNPHEPSFDSTRTAQARLWADGVALRGPDTDTLTGDNRDFDGQGIHFSPKGLAAHGRMWSDLVSAWLERTGGR